MKKVKRPLSKYDIGYNIVWHDGITHYVATFDCVAPEVTSSYIVPDDMVYPGSGPVGNGEPYLHHGTETLLYLNFLQLVKQLDVPAPVPQAPASPSS